MFLALLVRPQRKRLREAGGVRAWWLTSLLSRLASGSAVALSVAGRRGFLRALLGLRLARFDFWRRGYELANVLRRDVDLLCAVAGCGRGFAQVEQVSERFGQVRGAGVLGLLQRGQ